jgi:hypothetical protein
MVLVAPNENEASAVPSLVPYSTARYCPTARDQRPWLVQGSFALSLTTKSKPLAQNSKSRIISTATTAVGIVSYLPPAVKKLGAFSVGIQPTWRYP